MLSVLGYFVVIKYGIMLSTRSKQLNIIIIFFVFCHVTNFLYRSEVSIMSTRYFYKVVYKDKKNNVKLSCFEATFELDYEIGKETEQYVRDSIEMPIFAFNSLGYAKQFFLTRCLGLGPQESAIFQILKCTGELSQYQPEIFSRTCTCMNIVEYWSDVANNNLDKYGHFTPEGTVFLKSITPIEVVI